MKLSRVIGKGHKLQYKENYVDLLTDVVRDLLFEDKKQHLQTYGYILEKQMQREVESPVQSEMPSILDKYHSSHRVKQVHINLNKQSMVTKQWENVYMMLGDEVFRYFYKNYLIFLRTRDDSLVQISGQNIFVFLNDKFGRAARQDTQKQKYDEKVNQKIATDLAKAQVLGPDPT